MSNRLGFLQQFAATRAGTGVPAMGGHYVLGAVLIAGVAWVAYLPSLGGGFILDDDLLVTNNRLVAAPGGLYRIWCTTEPVDYWPLTNTSFWIEWRLWGMNPTGYHVTNLVLHIASALLVWAILHKLAIPGAWLAALLFAVHPVNVQSVTWIAQRKNTLSMLFFLLSILWYLKADRGMGLRRERSAERRWYALSLLAFTLAMLSKGSVAILPLVLLLLAWWLRGIIAKLELVRVAPFFAVAVALTAVNIWFQTHGSGGTVRDANFLERLLGAGAVVWFYLYKALLPLNLVFVYPQWNIQAGELRWWLPMLAVVAVTGVLLWQRQGRYGRSLLLAWLYFCVALLPVMGFTNIGFMKYSLVSDHYQHIAIIGVLASVAAGWSLWFKESRAFAAIAAVTVTGVLAVLSWEQCRLYRDSVILYEATLAKNPESSTIHNNLGSVLSDRGQLEKSIQHFEQSLRLNPVYVKAHYNLGVALARTGRTPEAIEHYRQALRLKPDAEAHNNLGGILAQLGKLPEAIMHFEQSVQLKPDLVEAHTNLGRALLQVGRLPEAIQQYQQALRFQPDSPALHNSLANALVQSGQVGRAIEHYDLALRLQPDFLETHHNLGIVLEQIGQVSKAIEHYQLAAAAYARVGRYSDAANLAQRALNLARSSGQAVLAEQIEERLRGYRAGKVDGSKASSPVEATR